MGVRRASSVQILGSGGFAARLARFGGGAAAGARSASDASGRFNRAKASRMAVTTTLSFCASAHSPTNFDRDQTRNASSAALALSRSDTVESRPTADKDAR